MDNLTDRLTSQDHHPVFIDFTNLPWIPQPSWLLLTLLAYPLLQQYFRYQRLNAMTKKYNYQTREALAKMTDTEAWKIMTTLAELEFPSMFEKGLQFALFRTYGIPSISRLLVQTTQFSSVKNAGKRYADTGVLVAEIMGNAPSSERVIESFGRLNYLHGVYRDAGKILNDDMLYTLALVAIEPIKWIERYDWRKLSDLERCAIATFVKSMGDAMLIDYESLPSAKTGFQDGLHWLEEVWQWTEDYEVKKMVPDKANHQTANETTAILLFTLPNALTPIGRHAVSAMMDDRLRKAMMYPRPPTVYFRVIEMLLAIRKNIIKYIALPRPGFMPYRILDDQADAKGRRAIVQYDAYPFYVRPTLWNRWGPSAWSARMMGLPLPGDDGDTYFPNGYLVPELGPKTFAGKGIAAADETKARLRKERTGGCPFAGLR